LVIFIWKIGVPTGRGRPAEAEVSDLWWEERMAHRAYDKCLQRAKFVRDGNEITEVLKAKHRHSKNKINLLKWKILFNN